MPTPWPARAYWPVRARITCVHSLVWRVCGARLGDGHRPGTRLGQVADCSARGPLARSVFAAARGLHACASCLPTFTRVVSGRMPTALPPPVVPLNGCPPVGSHTMGRHRETAHPLTKDGAALGTPHLPHWLFASVSVWCLGSLPVGCHNLSNAEECIAHVRPERLGISHCQLSNSSE